MASTAVMAQNEVAFSHYWEAETYFNPAAAGKQNRLNIGATYTVDFDGSAVNPQAGYVGADMPLAFVLDHSAAGVSFYSHKLGSLRHQRYAAQYAYRVKIGSGNLSLGIQGGMITERLPSENATADNNNGTTATNNGENATNNGENATKEGDYHGQTFDLAAGVYYTVVDWYLGVSAQHLNSPTVRVADEVDVKVSPAYYLTAGYTVRLVNPFVKIQPSVLLRGEKRRSRADITCRIAYTLGDKQLYCGASYSPDHSVIVLAGGGYKGFRLGYSYEYHTSGVQKKSGSHGFMAGYQTDLKLGKRAQHKQKSVRIL